MMIYERHEDRIAACLPKVCMRFCGINGPNVLLRVRIFMYYLRLRACSAELQVGISGAEKV